jgi:hypothetical protein
MGSRFLGEPPIIPIPGSKGFRMHIGGNITNSVVFIGFEDDRSPSGIECLGTGFLVGYDDVGYLVTARHVAKLIDGSPFAVRLNRVGEDKSDLIRGDLLRWDYHPDPTVDLAVIELTATREIGFKAIYLHKQMLMDEDTKRRHPFDVGDLCYTCGLFHFVSGKNRNLPLVYSGNIALMPSRDETIPIGTESGGIDNVEAYLIESGAIKGASGSPVFVRPSFSITEIPPSLGMPSPIVAESDFYLLGIYVGAWFLPADAALRMAVRAREQDIVPVGLGIVVPSEKLIELLEGEPVRRPRNEKLRLRSASQTALPVTVGADAAASGNPSHREDFTALLNAAAKTKPRGD